MMRQTYFGVNQEQFAGLEKYIKEYSLLTREMFNRSIAAEEKAAIQKKKEDLKGKISESLLENGTILGFLTPEKIDQLSDEIHEVKNDEVKGYLQSNFIPREKMEEVLFSLMNLPATESTKNIIFFLEKAKSNKQHIIVWIM
ncbi:hypothetical protein [Neobacillus citreus]|uniref:Uncharacterized protein n=1 Tax=Neobacillus citreus TaxID=2833578 RepID=A0A942TAS2_9BACI|nr:hypothetical protein [Neobacillus citreus]MCH6266993.1 hypothetical protein [Neobacillus citreus]